MLVCAPLGRDGELLREQLTRAGFDAVACDDPEDLLAKIDEGVGVLVLTEEALARPAMNAILGRMDRQPSWSDLSVLLLTKPSPDPSRLQRAMSLLGTVVAIDRPVRGVTFESAVRGLLRSRRRQYQQRDHLRREEEHREALARAERDARENLTRLRAMVEHLTDGVIVLDAERRVLHINQAALRVHGFPDADAAARALSRDSTAIDLRHAEDDRPVEPEERPWERAFSGERFTNVELRLHADDATRIGSYSGTPVYDEDGRFRFAVFTVRDVTDRFRMERRLRESEQRFRQLAEALPQLVWTAGAEGEIDYVNRRWVEAVGLTAEASRGGAWHERVHEEDRAAVRRAWERAVAGEEDYEVEYRLQDAAGETRWYLARALPLRDRSGRVVKWLGTCTDITDRKQSEEQLRRLTSLREHSLAQLRAVIGHMTEGLTIFDPEGGFVTMNPAALSLFGFRDLDEARTHLEEGRPLVELHTLSGDAVPRQHGPVAEALAEGRFFNLEYRVTRPGSRRWWIGSFSGAPVYDADGRFILALVSVRDVTEQKEAEEELRRSERRYRTLFTSMSEGFFVGEVLRDERGRARDVRFLEVNPAFETLTGVPVEEAVGRTMSEVHPDTPPDWIEFFARVVDRRRAERSERYAPRSSRWYEMYAFPTEPGRFAALFGDVTARKQAERALAESEARFRGTFENAAVGIAHVGADGSWLRVNQRLCDILGYSREELVRATWQDLTHPDDVDSDSKRANQLFAGEIDGYSIEKRYFHKAGHVVWANVTASIQRDESGRIVCAIAIVEDITARKQTEREREELAAIVESSHDAIVGVSMDGTIISWNDGAERIYGYGSEEAIDRPLSFVFSDPEALDVGELVERLRRGERVEPVELEQVRSDRARITASLTVSPVRDTAGTIVGASVIARDITERRRAEEHQKLLLAELNHRVKNTLTTVLSIASQTMARSTSLPAFREAFEGRLRSLAQAHALLTRANWRGTDLRDLVDLAVKPYRSRDGANVAAEGPPIVLQPKAALAVSMILHELSTNAAKYGALSNGDGRIDIRWERRESGEGSLVLRWAEHDGPPVKPPEGRGFGTTLIERSVDYELGGRATIDYREDGVRCEIVLPWSRQFRLRSTASTEAATSETST